MDRNSEPDAPETNARTVAWDELIAEADLCEYWGVTERTLRSWRASGRLAALYLPGGQVYYHPDDLLAVYSKTPPRRGRRQSG